ncbi:MAG: hypothetical protein HY274_03295 [Gammaproteobacteria bacterium]|nr:hypothetical protein [Gammaproteobacteria bacterium]
MSDQRRSFIEATLAIPVPEAITLVRAPAIAMMRDARTFRKKAAPEYFLFVQ